MRLYCTEVMMRPRQLLSSSSFSVAMQNSVRKSKLRLLTGGLCSRITATPAETETIILYLKTWEICYSTCYSVVICYEKKVPQQYKKWI